MVWDIDSPFTLNVVTACLVVLVSVNKMINECDNFEFVLYGFDFFFWATLHTILDIII